MRSDTEPLGKHVVPASIAEDKCPGVTITKIELSVLEVPLWAELIRLWINIWVARIRPD